jgi:sugar phosphate isomerase/epimerase
MKIDLGINNCFAVKRWTETEAWCQIVTEIFNVKNVQFSFDLLDPIINDQFHLKEYKKIREITKNFDIKINSTFTGLSIYSFNHLLNPDTGFRNKAIYWIEKAICASAEMGAEGIGGAFGALTVKDYQDQNRCQFLKQNLFDSLTYITEVAKYNGLKYFLWEPTPLARELSHTIEEAKQFYQKANENTSIPLLFCLDTGHACARDTKGADRDPYSWIIELGKYSPIIHLQQTDGKNDSHWPFTSEFNQQGIIKPNLLFDALKKSGVENVTLILEINHVFEEDDQKVIDDWSESVKYWKNELDKISYTL